MTVDTEILDLGEYIYARHWMDDYIPRQAPSSEITDGASVTFTNQSADRGRCLFDNNGTLNGQGSECSVWILEESQEEGKFYIRSSSSDKYLYCANGNNDTMVTLKSSNDPADDQIPAWAFDKTTFPGYVAICYQSTEGQAVNNNVNNETKTLRTVYHLVKERGLTLSGAKRQFKHGGPKETAETNSDVIDRLKAVKEELLALKEQLDFV